MRNISASFNSFFGSGAGRENTIGARNAFFGNAAGASITNGDDNSFFGQGAGGIGTTGNGNSFFVSGAGTVNTGANNTFVGHFAGNDNTTGSNNTYIGFNAGSTLTPANLTNATAIGADTQVSCSNCLILGNNANVGIGTPNPQDKLEVNGIISVLALGVQGGTPLCRNGLFQISSCPASSLRYKTNIASFGPGLNVVKRLRPITFNWKDGGTLDFGLIAEEVAEVEPLLATYRDGRVEGVKYDRIAVVLLNAVKEQQAQIERQDKEIAEQRKTIDGLIKIVCQREPTADPCKEP
jgi:hypothetical protein